MARPLRLQFENATYHITSRGNERKCIFRNEAERLQFLSLLGQVVDRFGWMVFAWTLMSNHYHLVIRTPQPNLSAGMHWLNSRYGSFVNRRRRRVGHLFQGRFKSILIEEQRYLNEVVRYTVLNPVRAGMVQHPADYRWSSFNACAGNERPAPWLNMRWIYALSDDPSESHAIFSRFVMEKVGSVESIWDSLSGQVYLGSAEWLAEVRLLVEGEERSDEHPAAQRLLPRATMEQVVASVAEICGVPEEAVCRRRGGFERTLAVWVGWQHAVQRLKDIGRVLNLKSAGHVSSLVQRCRTELARDELMRERCNEVIAALWMVPAG